MERENDLYTMNLVPRIKIPVKPYVWKFYQRAHLTKADRTLLRHLSQRGFSFVKVNEEIYSKVLEIDISQDDFLRYGASLNQVNTIVLQGYFEERVKELFQHELLANIRRSEREQENFLKATMINDLRDEYDLNEDELPFETIKKHLDRFCRKENIEFRSRIKFGNIVPKVVTGCDKIRQEFISLTEILKQTGINRRQFYRKYRKNVEATTYQGQLHVRITSLPDDLAVISNP